MVMMSKTDNSCSFGGDMLAYLYDELSSDGRERFEMHLEGCGLCIDELAELSEARYSVYEWKNVEFAPLATPRFVIPAEIAPVSASWLDAIRTVFSRNGAAALAGGVAVLLVGVFGFAMLLSSPDASVSSNAEPPAIQKAPLPAAPPTADEVKASVEAPEIEVPEVLPVTPRRSERNTVAARRRPEAARTGPVRRAPAEAAPTGRTNPTRPLDNSPTLGQYVEDRDESLRLSDLFDDLDSRELD